VQLPWAEHAERHSHALTKGKRRPVASGSTANGGSMRPRPKEGSIAQLFKYSAVLVPKEWTRGQGLRGRAGCCS
jgi:hypothetical protein